MGNRIQTERLWLRQLDLPEAGSEPAAPPGFFHHPYAFIPAVPGRPTAEDLAEPAAELADRPPMDHDRYHVGTWTGSLRVRMMVETPLLLPDAAAAICARSTSTTPAPRPASSAAMLQPRIPPPTTTTSARVFIRAAG